VVKNKSVWQKGRLRGGIRERQKTKGGERNLYNERRNEKFKGGQSCKCNYGTDLQIFLIRRSIKKKRINARTGRLRGVRVWGGSIAERKIRIFSHRCIFLAREKKKRQGEDNY